MRIRGVGETGDDRVLRLAPDFDPTDVRLEPAEGYLLSRIDGRTSWGMLRQIGGLPASDIDRCLEKWLADGVVELVGTNGIQTHDAPPPPPPEKDASEAPPKRNAAPKVEAKPAAAPPTESAAAPSPAADLGIDLDDSLELDLKLQEEILAFAARIERPYHEILEVAVDADARAIKKAYFAKSKRLHPDRYFRKNTGDFGPLIERCFKKLLEAYELLSDPNTRAEVQKNLAAAAPASEVAPGAAPESSVKPGQAEKSRKAALEARKRLRRKMGGHHQILIERKRKAKSFFESGMSAFNQERWLEAAGSVRLAIAFDPKNEAYRDAFGDVQRRAHEERAKSLVKLGEGALEMRDYREAFNHFEEAVHYRPFDADLAFRAANIAFQANTDLKRSKDLAMQACELEPENGGYRTLLGQIFKAAGLEANAKRELELAIQLDPSDKEAKRALRSL